MMDPATLDIVVPIGTFVLGFFVSRFTLSKRDQKDIQQRLFENSKALVAENEARYQEFCGAIKRYAEGSGPPTLDDFHQITAAGERYFTQQKITADAIFAGNVDDKTRDHTLVPGIKETIERSLPRYYESLKNIAQKHDLPYSGELRRENYESLYSVVEKYGRTL